jgi:hypothetical protein
MTAPIPLPLGLLAPPPELFTHESTLHGQAHVARVMVHAFRLIGTTGWVEEAPRLWAAVYLHDIARTHDGYCERHGADAIQKLDSLPEVRTLFMTGGVVDADYEAIRTAVVHHCLPKELDPSHPHWRLTALLKDADGLDRVRLGDLDPRYLRHAQSRSMLRFARDLFSETDGRLPLGDRHFETLWAHASGLSVPHDDGTGSPGHPPSRERVQDSPEVQRALPCDHIDLGDDAR